MSRAIWLGEMILTFTLTKVERALLASTDIGDTRWFITYRVYIYSDSDPTVDSYNRQR